MRLKISSAAKGKSFALDLGESPLTISTYEQVAELNAF
jgi:hypothetical protein